MPKFKPSKRFFLIGSTSLITLIILAIVLIVTSKRGDTLPLENLNLKLERKDSQISTFGFETECTNPSFYLPSDKLSLIFEGINEKLNVNWRITHSNEVINQSSKNIALTPQREFVYSSINLPPYANSYDLRIRDGKNTLITKEVNTLDLKYTPQPFLKNRFQIDMPMSWQPLNLKNLNTQYQLLFSQTPSISKNIRFLASYKDEYGATISVYSRFLTNDNLRRSLKDLIREENTALGKTGYVDYSSQDIIENYGEKEATVSRQIITQGVPTLSISRVYWFIGDEHQPMLLTVNFTTFQKCAIRYEEIAQHIFDSIKQK
ncbi:MAG: hypothetical protein NTX26_03565 [Candidatus Parcubacteria bacterium]|nr:hypothetical protein [Candidatus Parcubacteria bacterium]